MSILGAFLVIIGTLLRNRSSLALENLALRQQLAILHRKAKRPRLTMADRVFWVTLSAIWRECLDHLIILSENHLRRILTEYVRYYNTSRAHMALDGNSPVPRQVDPPSSGEVIAEPVLGGLHHRYRRAA